MNGTVNKVILIGHLGDDVKMHYFDGGNCIARFPLATNEVYINKQTKSRDGKRLMIRNFFISNILILKPISKTPPTAVNSFIYSIGISLAKTQTNMVMPP